jgi:hypothetical protein
MSSMLLSALLSRQKKAIPKSQFIPEAYGE